MFASYSIICLDNMKLQWLLVKVLVSTVRTLIQYDYTNSEAEPCPLEKDL